MNIIINGASSGIGREVVKYLAKDPDHQILATGRNEIALKELVEECTSMNVSYLRTDLTKLNIESEVVKNTIYNRFSSVDILVNVAGALVVKEFLKTTGEEEHYMMETNFFGPAAFTRIAVPLMPAGSHIVNISSMGGFQGSSKYIGLSGYSASKAALSCLSECLAVEFSDRGIKVNCLALGSVQTSMFEKAFPGFTAPVSPDEMAAFISYFAVNGSKFFNGKVIPVAVNNP